MDQYIPEFSARDIDGEQLLQMDGTKLKVTMRMVVMMGSLLQRNSDPLLSLSSAGSGRAQFVRPQHSEAPHQRRPNCGGEREESSGQTGETEGKTAQERPGAAQELTTTTRGSQTIVHGFLSE